MRLLVLLAAVFALTACGPSPRAPESATAQASAAPAPPAARSGYAPVQGGRIHYLVYGDLASGRTPLVVLHGTFMSAEMMAPLSRRFAATRPVIAIDARGHGATGDLPGAVTYDLMADDTAAVLAALNVPRADLLGYSMGATTAIVTTLRHPDRVGRLVSLSGVYRRDGWYPEIVRGLSQLTPAALAGSALENEYRRLSPTPNAFPSLVAKMRSMESQPYAWPEAALRALTQPTLVVIGDADGVQYDHALALFRLRGGGDEHLAAQGMLTQPPRARLAVLPATSHIGMMDQGDLLAAIVTPFLDDVPPPMGPGFTGPPSGASTAPDRLTAERTRR